MVDYVLQHCKKTKKEKEKKDLLESHVYRSSADEINKVGFSRIPVILLICRIRYSW